MAARRGSLCPLESGSPERSPSLPAGLDVFPAMPLMALLMAPLRCRR